MVVGAIINKLFEKFQDLFGVPAHIRRWLADFGAMKQRLQEESWEYEQNYRIQLNLELERFKACMQEVSPEHYVPFIVVHCIQKTT